MLPILTALLPLLSCEGGDDSGSPDDTGTPPPEPPGIEVASDLARETDPDVSAGELAQLTADNRAFAVNLLGVLGADEPGNLFLSPHSISVALAMTWAGARGETATQVADALRFTLGADALHPAFNRLDLDLATRDELDPELYEEGEGFRLSVANQLFGQEGYAFEPDFLDVLALHYGAGLRALDFASDPDGHRVAINDWVEAVTEDRIVDLLPAGSITSMTRLVLVNAIYFKASWEVPFEVADTADAAFHRLDGSEVEVPTMNGELRSRCGTGPGYAVVDLPYIGQQLAMTLVVPDSGGFEAVRLSLTGESLGTAMEGMEPCELTLALPRWSFSTAFNAKDPLLTLGMVDAFGAEADFSGVTTTEALVISGIYHQAFIAVNELGTEAAAATAVIEDGTSAPEPVSLVVDRPFFFLVRDLPTGAVLFLGQLLDPS